MNIYIGDRIYTVISENCRAAKELRNMMPLHITMQKLDGKEIYGDLPKPLTQDCQYYGEVHIGDILLWGDDMIVVSCKDFHSRYSFTKIGRIADSDGLRDAFNDECIEMTLN